MGDISNFDLDKFSKHVPTLLRHQLLLQLLNSLKHRQISLETSDTVEGVRGQSSSDSKETSPKESTQHILQTDLKPSIERFYGVLLFVDISGFTVLSQRLNVDELRLHINSYFQKILDIAELHGGEAVKFAGDALYIVWKVEEQPTNKSMFSFLRRLASTLTSMYFLCSISSVTWSFNCMNYCYEVLL